MIEYENEKRTDRQTYKRIDKKIVSEKVCDGSRGVSFFTEIEAMRG